jgi:hypothetical protein
VLLAHATGGLSDTTDGWESIWDDRGREDLNFRDGVLYRRICESFSGMWCPVFHVVWMPPEDEE